MRIPLTKNKSLDTYSPGKQNKTPQNPNNKKMVKVSHNENQKMFLKYKYVTPSNYENTDTPPVFSSYYSFLTITFNSISQKIKITMSGGKGDDLMNLLKNQMMFKIQSEQMKMEQEIEYRKLHMKKL